MRCICAVSLEEDTVYLTRIFGQVLILCKWVLRCATQDNVSWQKTTGDIFVAIPTN